MISFDKTYDNSLLLLLLFLMINIKIKIQSINDIH